MTGDTLALSRRAARWMVLGEWRANPARALTAALAIAIGVALGLAVHLINASALNEFSRAVSTVNGAAEMQVRAATPAGFDERLYPIAARTQGVAAASPVVELRAASGATTLTLLGLDVLRAGEVTPSLLGRATAGAGAPFDENSAFLSQAALDELDLEPGKTVRLQANGRTADFRIAGILSAVEGERRLAVVDIAAAQWRFGSLGRLHRLDLKLAEGADPGRVARTLALSLPPDAQLTTPQDQGRSSDALSRAYRVNLNMLALMALLTGAFLVFSAQSLSVARRRSQFALLRVLGVSRGALLIQVLVEGAVIGGLGAIAGLGLGVVAAAGALRILGGDLGGGYFQGERPELVFEPFAAAIFLLLGFAAALLGSVAPASEAARAQPAVALKNTGDPIDPRVRPKARFALLLLAAGGLAALGPPIAGVPVLGYAAMALMLAGGVAAMPWLARLVLGPLHRREFGAPPLDLALKRLWGAPSQAAVALCGIVASTSLMIAMAVMVTSFRGSVDQWLVDILPADVYLRVEGGGGFDPATQRTLASTSGISAVTFSSATPLRLNPDKPPVELIVRAATTLPLIGAARAAPAGEIAAHISEPASLLYGWRPGERISLPIGPQGRTRVFVAGVWRDYARQFGAVAISDADYSRLTGDANRSEAAVELAPGAEVAAVRERLLAALPDDLTPRVAIAEPRQLRALALRIFDRSFAVTYVLEGVAIVVGLAGVAATFSAQTLARAKEFGMLRHLGVTRGQVVAMLAAEGALLGAVGVVAGIGLGLVMSQVLIHVVNPQSFHWTMSTILPWGLFAVVASALVVSAAGAALLAGRRAVSGEAVRAVREDW